MAEGTARSSMADFAAKAAHVSNLLRALANENRLLILCTLVERGEATVTELYEAVGLSQSAMSQHLARMKDEGILASRREGAAMHYSIADRNIGRLLKTLKSIYC